MGRECRVGMDGNSIKVLLGNKSILMKYEILFNPCIHEILFKYLK